MNDDSSVFLRYSDYIKKSDFSDYYDSIKPEKKSEEILDGIDIAVIERYLRKKKLELIKSRK